jgi:hypothetical protein
LYNLREKLPSERDFDYSGCNATRASHGAQKNRDWVYKTFAYCNEEGDCELASINMVGFEVVTVVTKKIAVLCDAVPRSLVDTCRRFRGTFCIISVG